MRLLRRLILAGTISLLVLASTACGSGPTEPEPDPAPSFSVKEGSTHFEKLDDGSPQIGNDATYAWGATIINRTGSAACVDVNVIFVGRPTGEPPIEVRVQHGETDIYYEWAFVSPLPEGIKQVLVEKNPIPPEDCPPPWPEEA